MKFQEVDQMPTGWVIIKDEENNMRLFSSVDDTWRLSSPITSVVKDSDVFFVVTEQKTAYKCFIEDYNRFSTYLHIILKELTTKMNGEVITL